MKTDYFFEAITAQDIIKKQDLRSWIQATRLREEIPVALLMALFTNPLNWRHERMAALLAERLALIEAKDRTKTAIYIPCPGYEDARIIVPFTEYEPLIEHLNQRQLAFIGATATDPYLLILDVDPWEGERIPDNETFRYWTKIAADRGLSIPPGAKTIRGFTQAYEAVTYLTRARWTKSTVTPAVKDLLEADRLNPYWETPTHVYVWNETSLQGEDLSRRLAYLEGILYKKIRLCPTLYRSLGERKKIDALRGPNLVEATETSEIRDLWQGFLRRCITERHSDIHVAPNLEGAVAVCSRKAGRVRPRFMVPPNQRDTLYRIIMQGTGLDAMKDAHTPKDARGSLRGDTEIGRNIDFRYSLQPGPPPNFWPKVVMRILDPAAVKTDVTRLAVHFPEDKVQWEKILATNQGMILLVGPTGSGKSVTLYAMLHSFHRKDPGLTFHTIEDPIEFLLGPWLHQSEVRHNQNVTWGALLRQSLRNDIDGLMVGEIRDREVATLANEFAASGHILLSTLHTESSRHIPLRLKEMGVDTCTLANTLKVGVAQRLVALSCPRCQRVLSEAEKQNCLNYGAPKDALSNLRENIGCAHCEHEGVNGRTAIQEFTFIETESELEMVRNPDPKKLDDAMAQKGLLSLADKAWVLASRQLIPVSEALNIAGFKPVET